MVRPYAKTARTEDVKRVIADMQNSPTAAYLRELSFHERLMLAAILRCIKREGVEEIKWGDVCTAVLAIIRTYLNAHISLIGPTSASIAYQCSS